MFRIGSDVVFDELNRKIFVDFDFDLEFLSLTFLTGFIYLPSVHFIKILIILFCNER